MLNFNNISNTFRDLNRKALAAAEAKFEDMMMNRGSSRRKTHSELQEKLNVSVNDMRLYEKAVKQFTNKDTQAQLTKHLLKTSATEIVNTVCTFVAEEAGSLTEASRDKELSPEVQVKHFQGRN